MFFIHSSTDAYLCRFHVLPIANSAAVNIGVCLFFRIMVLLGVYLRGELLHHTATLFKVF